MLDSAAVVQAGIDVRDELPALLGPDAESMRQRLDELLGSALEADELAEQIRALLRSRIPTRRWLEGLETRWTNRWDPEPAAAAAPPPAYEEAPADESFEVGDEPPAAPPAP